MQYQGGKHMIARRLAEAILNDTDQRGDYYEPFIGGGSMAAQMGHHFDRAHYSDLHGPLILMWQAAHAGFIMHGDPGHFFPTDITRADYDYHKQHQPHSPATALIGFGSGFGGKYYGGYTAADTRYSDGRTYHHVARNGVMKKIRGGFWLARPQPSPTSPTTKQPQHQARSSTATRPTKEPPGTPSATSTTPSSGNGAEPKQGAGAKSTSANTKHPTTSPASTKSKSASP